MSHDPATAIGQDGNALSKNNLAQLFMRAFYWADEGLQNYLQSRGWPEITRAQSLVFVNIGEGITRPSEIAAKVGVTRQAIHQTINELVEAGFVTLEADPGDRRAKVLRFTEQGARIGKDAVQGLAAVESLLAERIGAETVKSLRDALERDWGNPFQA
ncbi:MAG: MarR family winged helix-turn-helix transcriptional regulator [Ketobacteraceae bacterium]|nr:MarR family winged helix-turn-helix transcriptional regulator [Ketobacteraceae bacterium]